MTNKLIKNLFKKIGINFDRLIQLDPILKDLESI